MHLVADVPGVLACERRQFSLKFTLILHTIWVRFFDLDICLLYMLMIYRIESELEREQDRDCREWDGWYFVMRVGRAKNDFYVRQSERTRKKSDFNYVFEICLVSICLCCTHTHYFYFQIKSNIFFALCFTWLLWLILYNHIVCLFCFIVCFVRNNNFSCDAKRSLSASIDLCCCQCAFVLMNQTIDQ